MGCTTLKTLGHKQREFCYSGSILKGEIVLHFKSGHTRISHDVFSEALRQFAGRRVFGGFKEDDPPSGGFGEWVQNQSVKLNTRKLTPRHGSFIAAILCKEAGVESSLEGNAIILRFPAFNHSHAGALERAINFVK